MFPIVIRMLKCWGLVRFRTLPLGLLRRRLLLLLLLLLLLVLLLLQLQLQLQLQQLLLLLPATVVTAPLKLEKRSCRCGGVIISMYIERAQMTRLFCVSRGRRCSKRLTRVCCVLVGFVFFFRSALGFESCSFRVWDCTASGCGFRGLGVYL